jgi:hypothetical protein
MGTPAIHHVRFADFVSLRSEGAGDLDGFRSAVAELVRRLGDPAFHNVLFDLRGAVLPPVAEPLLVQAAAELQAVRLGVDNKLAIVADPTDFDRSDRLRIAEQIAGHMGLRLRGFTDYGRALEWLNAPPSGSD